MIKDSTPLEQAFLRERTRSSSADPEQTFGGGGGEVSPMTAQLVESSPSASPTMFAAVSSP